MATMRWQRWSARPDGPCRKMACFFALETPVLGLSPASASAAVDHAWGRRRGLTLDSPSWALLCTTVYCVPLQHDGWIDLDGCSKLTSFKSIADVSIDLAFQEVPASTGVCDHRRGWADGQHGARASVRICYVWAKPGAIEGCGGPYGLG